LVSATVAWKTLAMGIRAVEIIVELTGLSIDPNARGTIRRKPDWSLADSVVLTSTWAVSSIILSLLSSASLLRPRKTRGASHRVLGVSLGKGFEYLGGLSNSSEHRKDRVECELMRLGVDAGCGVFDEHDTEAH